MRGREMRGRENIRQMKRDAQRLQAQQRQKPDRRFAPFAQKTQGEPRKQRAQQRDKPKEGAREFALSQRFADKKKRRQKRFLRGNRTESSTRLARKSVDLTARQNRENPQQQRANADSQRPRTRFLARRLAR